MRESRKRSRLPVLVALVGGGCMFLALGHFDAFEAFYEFSRDHEDWEIDEFAITIIGAVIIGLGVHAILLSRDLRELRDANVQLSEIVESLRRGRQLPENAPKGADPSFRNAAANTPPMADPAKPEKREPAP